MDGIDVIVVGAGPGGATAAYFLARGGARVRLLEREHFPRDKACGDAVSVEAFDLLLEMGLHELVHRGSFAWHQCLLTSPAGLSSLCSGSARPGELFGLVVPRERFDWELARAAVAAGAELWEGCRVQGAARDDDGRCVGVVLEREGRVETLRAPLVIAADGYHSAVARSFDSKHAVGDTAFAVRGYFEVPEVAQPVIELHLDRNLLPGYGWYFPVGNGVANVGVGMLQQPLKARALTLDGLFAQFMEQNRFVVERLRGARRIGRLRGAPLPMGARPTHTVRDGCMFVGDAAGFVDALTGEGISAAMHTGKMAAEVALTQLPAGDVSAAALADYDRRWRARYGRSLKAARFLQRMLGGGLLIDRLVRRSSQRPRLGAAMFDMVAGIAPKSEALRPMNLARLLF